MNLSKPGASGAIPTKAIYIYTILDGFPCSDTKSHAVRSMRINGLDWSKLFIHIEHRAGAVDREGLVHRTQIFTSVSQCVPVLSMPCSVTEIIDCNINDNRDLKI